MIDTEYFDSLARQYIEKRESLKCSDDKAENIKFKAFETFCINKFANIIDYRASRYKKFSNHPDLVQDGFEALLMALKTYDFNKGSFTWWADKYISTRIARSANNHSTIRIPISKAKEMKPIKTSIIPKIVDERSDAAEDVYQEQTIGAVRNAIGRLPTEYQEVINKAFGTNNTERTTMRECLMDLGIDKKDFIRIVKRSKRQLREELAELGNI